MESHPLRHFEQLQISAAANAEFPHTEISQQSYAQLPGVNPLKIPDIPLGNQGKLDDKKKGHNFHI